MAAVLLTGATGFVGRTTHRMLVGRGHHVRVLLRQRERASALAAVADSVVVGHLGDASTLRGVSDQCHAVVHLAACVDPSLQNDAAHIDAINHRGAVALAEEAKRAGVEVFVFASSIATMGFCDGESNHDSPCHPTTAYGVAKLAAERALTSMATDAFRVVTLRPPTVYGPEERYNFLSLIRAIDRGVFRLVGRGDNVMPLCTDENFARAACAAVEGFVPRGTYLIADRERYSMTRVHRAILTALGRREPRIHLPRSLAMGLGAANELISSLLPLPRILSRARVRTLVADQPFDVAPLLAFGVALDAPLEAHVATTIAGQRAAGLLSG